LSPRAYDPNAPVKVVDIDEKSLETLGQWPWPRTTLAQMVDKLHAAGAAAIAFDFTFPEADCASPEAILKSLPPDAAARLIDEAKSWPSNDSVFAAALHAANAALGVVLTENPADKTTLPAKTGFAVAGDDPKPFLNGFT